MDFLQPSTWDDALAAKAEHPDAVPVAGGTDVMVELNVDRRRPPALLDLSRVPALADWGSDGPVLSVGATVTYRRLVDELGRQLPGLATAARTVGSPQVRNRGTIGGSLGSASPAGDAHPPLLAADAVVELASVRGVRRVPVEEFFIGPRRTVLAADELIAAVLVPRAAGPQQFAKVGLRNAMIKPVCSFALTLNQATRRAGTGLGCAGPVPRRAPAAESFLSQWLPWGGGPLPPDVTNRFGELVAEAVDPVDDIRGSAAYRRHALSILARRTLAWAWTQRKADRCG